jgi:fumarate reductase subunit C
VSRRPFVRPVSRTRWYFAHPRYLRYLSREATCLGIGALALLMVCALDRLAAGRLAWESFVAALATPWIAVGLVVVLVLALHNAISWFRVAPKAMPVQVGERFLPAWVVVVAHYLAWIVVSLAVLYFVGVLQP